MPCDKKILPPVVICAAVRNGGIRLPHSLRAIDQLRSNSAMSKVIIVTNDNADDTQAILRSWADCRNNVIVINLDGIDRALFGKLDRLAFARNTYISELMRFDNVDYEIVCIMDMDGPNESISATDVATQINELRDWSALFANQRVAYYDIFALRHTKWCPNDCWQEVGATSWFPFGSIQRQRAIRRLVYSRQYLISPSTPMLEVDSAFGGFGIYRKQAIRGCWYGGRDKKGREICEHVVFHQQMRANGRRLFIAPALLNDAPPEHLGPGSGQPFPSSNYIIAF